MSETDNEMELTVNMVAILRRLNSARDAETILVGRENGTAGRLVEKKLATGDRKQGFSITDDGIFRLELMDSGGPTRFQDAECIFCFSASVRRRVCLRCGRDQDAKGQFAAPTDGEVPVQPNLYDCDSRARITYPDSRMKKSKAN